MTATKIKHDEVETIDMTPTWRGLMPGLIAVLQNAKAPNGTHGDIRAELHRMAKAAGSKPVIVDHAIGVLPSTARRGAMPSAHIVAEQLLYQLAQRVDDQIAQNKGGE